MTRHEIDAISYVNWMYSKAINDDRKSHNQRQLARADQTLFNLTMRLNISDWKKIRGESYFEKVKDMTEIDRKKYLISLIRRYKIAPSVGSEGASKSSENSHTKWA